jgi:hypothetical protein
MVFTEQERKERKAIVNKKYRDANKEKVKAYDKQYYVDNKDKKDKQNKEWGFKNPQKRKDIANKYARNNPKILTINKWKSRGVIDDDWDGLYDYFITQTNCWICDKVYNNKIKMDYRCLEHDHDLIDEPNVRYICCGYCNIQIVR